MKKEQKKEIEQQIIQSIEQLLSTHNAPAAEKVRKHVKDAGKAVAKKFYKAVKTDSSQAKIVAEASGSPEKKVAVAVAALSAQSPASSKTAAKSKSAKKKGK